MISRSRLSACTEERLGLVSETSQHRSWQGAASLPHTREQEEHGESDED